MTSQEWQHAEFLFHGALELPPGEREVWLARSCSGDPEVGRAVRRMLEADANPGDEIRRAVRTALKEWLTE